MKTNLVMNKKERFKYENWIGHLNNTKDRTNYSIRRMDLLIISISGAGIYIIFETLREFKIGNIIIENPKLLIWSGIILLVCIISNFISQITGYQANSNEEKYIYEVLNRIEGDKYDKCLHDKYDKNVELFNWWTDALNTSSIILMFLGLILLAIFNYLLV